MKDKNNIFSSSIITAICTKTFIAPLTRIKVLQQVQTYYNTQNYTNLFSSFKYIKNNEGFVGFYKGNLANIAKSIPNYCIKFPINEFYINYLLNKHKLSSRKELSFYQLLQAGMFTGWNQTMIAYPIDLIRTRVSLDTRMKKTNNGIFKTTIDLLKNEGLFSLYKGLIPAATTTPIYIGLQLSIYQQLRNSDNNYTSNSLVSGAIAGLISQTAMYPGDTIKRQLQINGMQNKIKHYGLIDCITNIYKENGIRGFYRGLYINSIKSIPEIAVKFTIFELCKTYLDL